ncbi:MAG: GDSL-type esterase/lipase family protein [Pirellula sp.]
MSDAESRDDYLSSHGLTVYAEAAKKWNDDVEKLAARNSQESNPEAILFIGSSTIRLWDSLEQDLAPYKTIKRGFGGAKFCDLAIHCPRLVGDLNYRAAVVFIANDIKGDVSDKEPAEIKRLARITIESLKARNPSAPVIILSITATPSRFAYWNRIQTANRMLSTLASEMQGIYFLETEKHYLAMDGKPIEKYFVEDRLHQTPEGYRLLGSLVKSKLDEVLPPETSR